LATGLAMMALSCTTSAWADGNRVPHSTIVVCGDDEALVGYLRWFAEKFMPGAANEIEGQKVVPGTAAETTLIVMAALPVTERVRTCVHGSEYLETRLQAQVEQLTAKSGLYYSAALDYAPDSKGILQSLVAACGPSLGACRAFVASDVFGLGSSFCLASPGKCNGPASGGGSMIPNAQH